jgi:hypothetical protein
MRRRAATVVVAATLVLGLASGCTGGGDDDGGATTTSTTSPAATAGSPSTSRPRVGDAGGTGIAVTLAANRLVVGGNALVFGAPAFQVRSYLERALLDPTKEDQQDCPPGPLTAIAWPDLTVYLNDADELVGWYTTAPTLVTDAGIHVGSARTEVEAAYPGAQITETTLGTELWAPLEGQGDVAGLSGVFDPGTSTLTALWSGATCLAR